MRKELGTAAERLRDLNIKADEKRAGLLATLNLARERARPANIAARARHQALDCGLEVIGNVKAFVRANPLIMLGTSAIVGAMVARRPLSKLLATGFAMSRKLFRANRR